MSDRYEPDEDEKLRFYSPVGRGISLLRAQGSISYVQSDKETYDMDDWIEKLASQYGAKQAAALRGDETTFKVADDCGGPARVIEGIGGKP